MTYPEAQANATAAAIPTSAPTVAASCARQCARTVGEARREFACRSLFFWGLIGLVQLGGNRKDTHEALKEIELFARC